MTEHNKEKIQAMILESSDAELCAVWLPRIMNLQEYEERTAGKTMYANGKGLNSFHAKFLASIWKQIGEGKQMSMKQTAAVKKVLAHYWKQYAAMMEANEDKKQRKLT